MHLKLIDRVTRQLLLWGLDPLRRLGTPVPVVLTRHLHFKGVIRVPVAAGQHFRMRSYGHAIENNLYWYGIRGHEPETLLPWVRAAASATVVLDIGANTGLYSLAALASNPNCKAFAFEPVPRIAAIIRDNASENAGYCIEVCEYAASDRNGVVKLYDPGGDQPASASLRDDFLAVKTTPIEVQSIRIDDFVSERDLDAVDLIKLDVEGVEERVLKGMRRTIQRFRPMVFMELLNDRPELLEEIERLQKLDYQLFGLTTRGPERLQHASAAACQRNLLLAPVGSRFAEEAFSAHVPIASPSKL